MVVADDRRNLRVLVHVSEDALADCRVLLHLPALLERERARLLEESRGEADLANVVHEATEVRLVANLVREPHALGDVSRVDRDRGRVARRVAISRIESGDECGRELKVRAFERFVCFGEVNSQLSLLLIQAIESLSRHCGDEEQRQRPWRDADVHEGQERNDWRVDRRGSQHDRNDCANGITDWPSTDACSEPRKENIKYLADDGSCKRRRNEFAELRRDGRQRRLCREPHCSASNEPGTCVCRPLESRRTIWVSPSDELWIAEHRSGSNNATGQWSEQHGGERMEAGVLTVLLWM